MNDESAPRADGSQRQALHKRRSTWEEESARRRAALASQQGMSRQVRVAEFRRLAQEAILGDAGDDAEAEVTVEDIDEEDGEAAQVAGDIEMSPTARRGAAVRRLRRLHRTLYFARQLQIPDWMVEVPEDLGSSWLLQVRPEGERCLLLADGGRVQVRKKNGRVIDRYHDDRLPRGLTVLDVVCLEDPVAATEGHGAMEADEKNEEQVSMATETPEPADGTMPEADGAALGRGSCSRGRGQGRGQGRGRTNFKITRRAPTGRSYMVCDVLAWGDVDLVCAEAECRRFWLESRFAEIDDRRSRQARALRLVPWVDVGVQTLEEAYKGDPGYVKDSLVFFHRQGHYETGATPLALAWRDRQVSRYVVDTPDVSGETLPEKQAVVLELRGSGYLRTADRFVVAQCEPEAFANLKVAVGSLVRCEIEAVDLTTKKISGCRPVAHVAARSRCWADTFGRIAFQHVHREGLAGKLSIDVLARASAGILVSDGQAGA